jgi:hypothetical protein
VPATTKRKKVKRFTTLLWIAAVVQLSTGLIHGLSFFMEPPPAANATEAQLLDLFSNYKQDMGAGIYRTTADIFLSISICFTLLFLFAGSLNVFLLRKGPVNPLTRGLLTLQCAVFGVCFVAMMVYAFLPPMILAGLSFFFLLGSRMVVPPVENS